MLCLLATISYIVRSFIILYLSSFIYEILSKLWHKYNKQNTIIPHTQIHGGNIFRAFAHKDGIYKKFTFPWIASMFAFQNFRFSFWKIPKFPIYFIFILWQLNHHIKMNVNLWTQQWDYPNVKITWVSKKKNKIGLKKSQRNAFHHSRLMNNFEGYDWHIHTCIDADVEWLMPSTVFSVWRARMTKRLNFPKDLILSLMSFFRSHLWH